MVAATLKASVLVQLSIGSHSVWNEFNPNEGHYAQLIKSYTVYPGAVCCTNGQAAMRVFVTAVWSLYPTLYVSLQLEFRQIRKKKKNYLR